MEYKEDISRMVRMDLIDGGALLRVGKVMQEGAVNHEPDGWRKKDVGHHLNAAIGHVCGFLEKDQGTDHLARAACRLLMAMGVEGKEEGEPENATVEYYYPEEEKVYICAPLAGAVSDNIDRVRNNVVKLIQIYTWEVEKGIRGKIPLIIVPHFALNGITIVNGTETNRDLGMVMCGQLLEMSDRIVVLGKVCTPGMRMEISWASQNGIPISWFEDIIEDFGDAKTEEGN